MLAARDQDLMVDNNNLLQFHHMLDYHNMVHYLIKWVVCWDPLECGHTALCRVVE